LTPGGQRILRGPPPLSGHARLLQQRPGVNEIAELRHRDASKRKRRHVTHQGDSPSVHGDPCERALRL